MRKKQGTIQEATIARLGHDGRGIAQENNGKIIFIRGALPQERVNYKLLRSSKKFIEGTAVEILQPAANRIVAKCPHYGECGGCSLQHLSTSDQLNLKQHTLLEQLAHFAKITPPPLMPAITGEPWSYRTKARLGVKYLQKYQQVIIGFRQINGRYLADLKHCDILHPKVAALLLPLRELILNLSIPDKIPQIEVAVGEQCTTLIFRHLDPFTNEDHTRLCAFAKKYSLELILQPNKPQQPQKIWPVRDSPLLSYGLPELQLELLFNPTDFTQVNQEVNRKMINRALELLALESSDFVLDLFCGLGNFSLPIARFADTVIGVELDQQMVAQAKKNAAHNQLHNCQFYAADLTKELAKQPWLEFPISKALIDPPRSGAQEIIPIICKLGLQRLVYVSCNPATFARDAGLLQQHGFILTQCGLIDMFPQTSHVETIGCFERKQK